jgi:hypothetical protein
MAVVEKGISKWKNEKRGKECRGYIVQKN